jgi:HK97 family phage portal protein
MPKLIDRINGFLHPPETDAVPSQKRDVNSALKGSFNSMIGLSDSGIVVTEESSLKFSAVWAARRILSELPASLPLEFYEEKGASRTPVEHQAKEVLMHPNALMNRFTWTELMNDFMQGWGNAVSIIDNRKNGYPETLMPVDPESVKVKIDQGKLFYLIDDRALGIKGTFYSEEVLHYKFYSRNGIWGKSPIHLAKENIGLGLATERFGAKFFRRGGNIKAVIETPGHMGDKEFKEWKDRWNRYYTGDAGDWETPVLEYGMAYKPLGIAPEDAQFLQTRQFSIQDIARWFNLPPHMLGDLSRATFSNIEHQDLQFVKYTLRPILRRQEIELEEKLLLPKEKGKIRIRYNLDGLLRGDLASVTSHIKEMVQIGVLSPDEGRALLNKNPRPGGDEFYTPANIVGNTENINNNVNNKKVPVWQHQSHS